MAFRGAKAHIRRLQALASAGAEREIGKALFAGGELIQTYAQKSITTGSVSGKAHVPSAPGTPPNNDSGVLADGIETTQPAVTRVIVTSTAPYSGRHEFGPEGRKFMRPARDAKRKEVKALVEQALGRVVKKSRRSD